MSATTALRAPVPLGILPLVAAVAVGGCAAALLAATPVLLLTSPMLAACLAAAALYESSAGLRTLERLPAGRARELLEDVLRRAAVVPMAARVGPLVRAACEGARQLSALELHLAAFDARQTADRSARWHDALDRCQRGRDLLTHRLQDAAAAISRWQAEQSRSAAADLAELARELNDESRFQREAAQEVDALLS